MISNTATPKYYGEFRASVMRGEVPVNREISEEMKRIDKLIADPKYYYDDVPVEGWISYCENELTLTDGSDMTLLPSFKLWGEQIFGWYYYVERDIYIPDPITKHGHYERRRIKKRLIKKQYLIVARGAAKSMYASCMQSYFLNMDTSTTKQITTAPTMAQADEVMSPIRTSIIRARGPLFKFLTQGSQQSNNKQNRPLLDSTKKGIENHMTGSLLEVRPMAIDKLQGLRLRCATIDEWLSGEIKEDPVAAIEQGSAKEQNAYGNNDYIIFAISSEGNVRNGIGDSMKMELESILKGEYDAPHISIWWYKLDNIYEVNDPEMWIKANPNIGQTVLYETYQEDVERAEKNPIARNEILAKRFGLPMEGYTYFFTYEETLPHPKKEYWKMSCSMGADLSQGDDFCSFVFLFPLPEETFGIKTRNYITEDTLLRLPAATREKYNEFISEGSLCVMPGTVLDMIDVYEDLDKFIQDNNYDVNAFGFDPYNAREFVERWCMMNGEYNVEKVIQGAKTESVPLGELKKLASQRKLLFDESLMTFAMGNAVVMEDTNGNRKLRKLRYEAKIDPVAAMMDAFVAFKLHREEFE